MKFLVLVLCLLSERFLIHSLMYQRFTWFGGYAQKIISALAKEDKPLNPWLGISAVVLPVLLGVALIYWIFQSVLFGLVGLILSILIFAYCLGPQNVFYPPSESDSEHELKSHIGTYLASANSQLFTVIFWYILIGPIAVVAYRIIALCKDIQPLTKEAAFLTDIIEWLPARLTALLYLLVGNFQNGIGVFMLLVKAKPEKNYELLSECGIKAMETADVKDLSMPKAEMLVEYATVALLVVIALSTLTSWM